MTRPSILLAAATVLPITALPAQEVETLDLATVHALVDAADARWSIAVAEREASVLRSGNLKTATLPGFALRGEAAYQSEVIALPLDNPAFTVPAPPQDRYEFSLDMDWTVWDGGVTRARGGLEATQLDRTMAALDAEIYGARRDATEAFFVVLALQQQATEIGLMAEDATARLSEVRTLVEEGVALPGESATLHADLLRLEQRRDALLSERTVALETLSRLTGRPLAPDVDLVLPELGDEVTRLRSSLSGDRGGGSRTAALSSHPQFALFDAQRRQVDGQIDLIHADRGPTVSAFGQLGFGRPGYDQFNDSFHEYWRTGVRVVWAPWRWGRNARRERETELQKRVIDAREEFFTDEVLRAVEGPLRTAEYMRSALSTDDAIITLREEAAEYARAHFIERTISASAYSAALTALQDARIARLQHQVALARAEAFVLLTLGMEIS